MESKMIRNRDIIVTGLQPWDIEIGSNCRNIAMELSRHNRVLYVNRALDRISALRQRQDAKTQTRLNSLKGITNDLQQVADNLWTLDPRTMLESINWMPVASIFDRLNLINNKRLAKQINQAVQRLEFNTPLLFIDNDFFRGYYLPELLKGVSQTIYYIRDNLTCLPYFKKHGQRLEPQLMQRVSMVAANSAWLANYAAKHNPSSFDIGQGCDLSWLRVPPAARPMDIAQLEGPVIGYVGALLSARLDIALLEEIATRKPEWNFVLVGPEDDNFKNSRLHQLPNVLFTGNKPFDALPAYINSFDVCINPQSINPMTIGNYPRKIDEYLALGKPVVATATAAMEMFAPYVYLCGDAAGYIHRIATALQEPLDRDREERRKAFALSHTWENSVAEMGRQFENVIQPKKATYAGK
ncbi:glycosyltransferase family 1 protein [Chitinophaga sp. G-6-1-13]|uniref:Glycosyltransferase family 1 protein n=2 Tax=Chitinophaga fulva TaxID=2728842 RepID=A0A848GKD0_9BACT|nr:glycosyltransferase family 1 protein [Chitinophaga fulva]